MNSNDIVVMEELRTFITPNSKEARQELKESLVREGCRDALIVWENSKNEQVILDGHHRYEVCKKLGIPFRISEINSIIEEEEEKIYSLDDAKRWMAINQRARRNLTDLEYMYFRGYVYESLKIKRGGVREKGSSNNTAEKLGKMYKVNPKTIIRDGIFCRGLDFVASKNPELKNKILLKETVLKKGEIQFLGEHLDTYSKKIKTLKNESDLFNKLQHIRKQIEAPKLPPVYFVSSDKEKNLQYWKNTEGKFPDPDQRIIKIKGALLSSINAFIETQEPKAIKDLKRFVTELEKLVIAKKALS
jgi:hypothetical protein